jgi:hypothetical protein
VVIPAEELLEFAAQPEKVRYLALIFAEILQLQKYLHSGLFKPGNSRNYLIS